MKILKRVPVGQSTHTDNYLKVCMTGGFERPQFWGRRWKEEESFGD